MARPKEKDSVPMAFRLDTEVVKRLNDFCSESGQSKTKAVERALNEYFDGLENGASDRTSRAH